MNPNNPEKFITGCLSYPEGKLYCGSDETRSILIWESGMREPSISLRDNSSAATKLLLNNKTYELFAGMNGGKISLWDIYKKKIKFDFIGHSSIISAMSLYKIKNENILLSAAAVDGKIKLWDLKNKNECINLKRHFSEVNCLEFSPDFTYFASCSQDGLIKIYDLRNQNKCLKEIDNKISVNCFKFNPYKTTFAFGTKDKVVKYYDMKNFEMISQSKIERSPIEKIEFDNNGNNLFVATNDSLKYYNIEDNFFFNELMIEIQWKKLQDFQYLENRAICAVSINGSKLSYYFIKYKDILGKRLNNHNATKMSNIKEENEEYNLINESNLDENLTNNKNNINEKNFDNFQNSNVVLDSLNIITNENNNNKNNIKNNKNDKSKFINNSNINDNSSVMSDFDLSTLAKGGKINN